MSSRGLPSTFAAACRGADREQRKKPRDPHIERLRQLLESAVTLSVCGPRSAGHPDARRTGPSRH